MFRQERHEPSGLMAGEVGDDSASQRNLNNTQDKW